MATTEELASFTEAVAFEELDDDTIEELKKRVLDSVGIAVGALGAEPVEAVRETVEETAPGDAARLWGSETRASPTGAAMYNTTLTRYLDFMDSFLAPGETPHPSDNIASLIACGEHTDATGTELVEAIGVSYEIQGELAWNAPVRDRGFDHVTHTVISATAGAGKVLGLDHEELRNAVGIAGTAHNALRVTRTGGINEWKGVASANAARNAVYSALLASNGMDGPTNLFEGQKGWKQIIAGDFTADLDSGCERVFDTMTKRYVAETYAQSAVEGVIELAEHADIDPDQVNTIHLDTFHGAKLIIGGGEGSRYEVETKAQADHSLPYMLAAALIDRELTNDAYDPERIQREDVQKLLRTVEVEEDEALTERFENGEMPAVVDIELANDSTRHIEKDAFSGHPTDPMTWEQVEAKFETMTEERYDEDHRERIVDVVRNLETHDVADLVTLME
ncbi:MmgE/PrpD family protein [Halococcus saccharolyticus]|uniref:Propionate catabolism protein n=1 Tax=Halococcus saccharolyticus DSM 5350 TaxID=1227455 RepID=M0ME95_9EURY|nr:MmgE/PrpD family protein [Halococcus saccharolyticus]EMA44082.1 propionate catabolism protein [Halococcus saccharolyticus DSM 5350]